VSTLAWLRLPKDSTNQASP